MIFKLEIKPPGARPMASKDLGAIRSPALSGTRYLSRSPSAPSASFGYGWSLYTGLNYRKMW